MQKNKKQIKDPIVGLFFVQNIILYTYFGNLLIFIYDLDMFLTGFVINKYICH